MKKILSLALGLSFVFGTLAMAQDASKDSGTTNTNSSKKHHEHHHKDKSHKTSTDSSAPKQ